MTWSIDIPIVMALIGLVGLGGGLWKFIRDVNNDNQKLTIDREKQRSILIERIDFGLRVLDTKIDKSTIDLKDYMEQNYTRNKYCEIVHRNSAESFLRIEEAIKGIWLELKAMRIDRSTGSNAKGG